MNDITSNLMKSAQRRRKHCALAVVRRTDKQTNKHTHRQGRLQYTAQLSAQCKDRPRNETENRPFHWFRHRDWLQHFATSCELSVVTHKMNMLISCRSVGASAAQSQLHFWRVAKWCRGIDWPKATTDR